MLYWQIRLLDSVKNQEERLWYIQQTIENVWSRAVLEYQIESRLYQRQEKTNCSPETKTKICTINAKSQGDKPWLFKILMSSGNLLLRAVIVPEAPTDNIVQNTQICNSNILTLPAK